MYECLCLSQKHVLIVLTCVLYCSSKQQKNFLHVHVPEGAVQKDGPSAGIALVSSLVSLALNKPLLPDVAMTGEITLTGIAHCS